MPGELVFDRQDAISDALKIFQVAAADFCGIQQYHCTTRLLGRSPALSLPTVAQAGELLVDRGDIHGTGSGL
jgi:hypothetical protein